VLGCGLQLQQSALWPGSYYLALMLASLSGSWLLFHAGLLSRSTPLARAARWLGLGALAAATGFAGVGLRAQAFDSTRLDPQWEGRDIRVVGVVAAMPQRNEAGLRFRLKLESARVDGAAAALPPQLLLGWYSGLGGFDAGNMLADLQQQPADVRAGERWQLTVRLKAPHGASNPFGFDYELWLWEQGVQATGYVRAGSRDAVPERLGQTLAHPVEQARQGVRDAILQRIPDRQQAGLVAALVVGDQNAIDRW
jgi:competence protein ComEC